MSELPLQTCGRLSQSQDISYIYVLYIYIEFSLLSFRAFEGLLKFKKNVTGLVASASRTPFDPSKFQSRRAATRELQSEFVLICLHSRPFFDVYLEVKGLETIALAAST